MMEEERWRRAGHLPCGGWWWWTWLLWSSSLVAAAGAGANNGTASSSKVTDSDVAALLAIKQALVDPRGALTSWSTSNVAAICQGRWTGVKCGEGQVIGLHLPSKGLGGQIAAEVGQLPSLRQLSLHTNAIGGSIPLTISGLRNLRGLYLFRNRLTGGVPASFSPVLQALDLSHNSLSGPIPPTLPTSSSLLRRLDLSRNNLSSTIPTSLSSLSRLQTLFLSHNQLVGSVPAQMSQLASLHTLDLSSNSLNSTLPTSLPLVLTLNLSHNLLNGPLPINVAHNSYLLTLDLSYNHLTHTIPAQIANLTSLSSFNISHNNFTGTLPSSLSKLTNLTSFNCSYNRLTGRVPVLAHSFDASAYEGNVGLCGFSPSSPCVSSSPSPAPSSLRPSEANKAEGGSKKKFSVLTLVFIIVGVVVVLFLALCVLSLLFLCCCRKSEVSKAGFPGEKEGPAVSAGKEAASDIGGKLVHFEGSLGFAADDLLCATAEVLGKSTYGTVYKATLEDGNQVAVKRLREGIVKSQRDFEVEVTALGRIRHPNLLALRAYYWGPKDEKLLIFDFMQGGSLAAFLHARGPEAPLTWQTRIAIALGAARGLAYLHEEESIIHGNLTSSNILLDSHLNPKLSDFGLSRLMTTAANSNVIATAGALGYRAPELTKLRKATTKSDVYSFGIVLLELLTGKAPGEGGPTGESGMDLPDWVASIVKEEWTSEVFDLEIMRGRAPGDDELINTLQLAMSCVKLPALERPEMSEVVMQLEQVMPGLRQ